MKATINLTRYNSEDHSDGGLPRQQAWPLEIVAVGTGMPSEIFVYQMGKAGDLVEGDRFNCVASPNQLEEIPREGFATSKTPFYRSNSVTFICRSAEEADYIWREIVKEVEYLVRDFNTALRLLGVEQVLITNERTESKTFDMNPPLRLQLSAYPAGSATIADGRQTIVTPDNTYDGWLPVSEVPPGWIVPEGAEFFYNISRDLDLSKAFPLKQPFSGHILTRNGITLPYGVVYEISKDTIYWLRFTPENLPGYTAEKISAYGGAAPNGYFDSNAPWAYDYVNRNNPGSMPPNLTITIFQ